MNKLWIRIFIYTAALIITSYILDSVIISGVFAAFIAAIIFSVFNIIIKPVLIILSLPINILSFGLFTFIINGIIFSMVAFIVPGFTVRSFFGAVIGSIFVSILNIIISRALDKNK